jgi:hypothetical protein
VQGAFFLKSYQVGRQQETVKHLEKRILLIRVTGTYRRLNPTLLFTHNYYRKAFPEEMPINVEYREYAGSFYGDASIEVGSPYPGAEQIEQGVCHNSSV